MSRDNRGSDEHSIENQQCFIKPLELFLEARTKNEDFPQDFLCNRGSWFQENLSILKNVLCFFALFII